MKRKWEERLKKVEELASHYERNPLPPVYRPKLSKPFLPSSVWKIFCRQAEAFDYVKTCKEVNYLLGGCLYSLGTFKVDLHIKAWLTVKSLSDCKIFFFFFLFFPPFFPILKQQVFFNFFVFVDHATLEVGLRSTSSNIGIDM